MPTNMEALAPLQPKLLIQIVETAPGHVEIHSPLPGPLVIEILIKLLPGAWEATKQGIKDKAARVVAPQPGLMAALRRGLIKTNGRH